MMKGKKAFRIFIAFLIAAISFAAGLTAAGLIPERENNDAKEIQEQLPESYTFPAEAKVLEEISLDVDPSARGDVYMERAAVLTNMYQSAENRHEYFLIKLMEILPASEVSELNRSYRESSEYAALYLYGIPDKHSLNLKYALQWGDVIVALEGWMGYLEEDHMEIVKGRICGDSENSEMLVIWDYEGMSYAFVKEGDTITQYTVRGPSGPWVLDIYYIAPSGSEVTVYTHNTALTVTAEGEDEWDKKIYGGETRRTPGLGIYAWIEACGENEENNPLARKTHVARLYGSIYLDTENNQFIIKDFYLTK